MGSRRPGSMTVTSTTYFVSKVAAKAKQRRGGVKLNSTFASDLVAGSAKIPDCRGAAPSMKSSLVLAAWLSIVVSAATAEAGGPHWAENEMVANPEAPPYKAP